MEDRTDDDYQEQQQLPLEERIFEDEFESVAESVFMQGDLLRTTGDVVQLSLPLPSNDSKQFVDLTVLNNPLLAKHGEPVSTREDGKLKVWFSGFTVPGIYLPLLEEQGSVQMNNVWLLTKESMDRDAILEKVKRANEQILKSLRESSQETVTPLTSYASAPEAIKISLLNFRQLVSADPNRVEVETTDPEKWFYYIQLADGRFIRLRDQALNKLIPRYAKITDAPPHNCFIARIQMEEQAATTMELPVPHFPPSIFGKRFSKLRNRRSAKNAKTAAKLNKPHYRYHVRPDAAHAAQSAVDKFIKQRNASTTNTLPPNYAVNSERQINREMLNARKTLYTTPLYVGKQE